MARAGLLTQHCFCSILQSVKSICSFTTFSYNFLFIFPDSDKSVGNIYISGVCGWVCVCVINYMMLDLWDTLHFEMIMLIEYTISRWNKLCCQSSLLLFGDSNLQVCLVLIGHYIYPFSADLWLGISLPVFNFTFFLKKKYAFDFVLFSQVLVYHITRLL